jgi:hypothetical protein
VLLAACGGSDGPTSPGRAALGAFSGTASGGLTKSIEGIAFYGQSGSGQTGETAFQIGMGSLKGDSTFDDVVVISRARRDLPAAGTYTLHDVDGDGEPGADDFMLIAALSTTRAHDVLCTGTVGTVTITGVGGGRVKGRYATTASCIDLSDLSADPMTATLAGTFDAVEGTRATGLPSRSREAPMQTRLTTVRIVR